MKRIVILSALLIGCGEPGFVDVLGQAPEGALLSVWGPSADDVWIAGGQPEAGVIFRGSGSTFETMSVPADTPMLNWVHGTGADDVWVGGLSGTMLHWDGTDWTDHSEPIDEAIWGLYARRPDDVWFVGGESRWGGDTARVLHYDGLSMRPVELPAELGDVPNMFKVHDDGSRMWFVGAGGAAAYETEEGLRPAATGFSGDLVTANLGMADRLIVVGGRGTGNVFQQDGERLTELTTTPAGLNGVVGLPDHALVVGETGFMGMVDRSDGTVTLIEVPTRDILHAVWISPDDTVYSVGGNLGTADPTFHGTLIVGPLPETP
ncbi:MAG: hypothetical protein ACJAZO_004334 [Myxococcota bacterium]